MLYSNLLNSNIL